MSAIDGGKKLDAQKTTSDLELQINSMEELLEIMDNECKEDKQWQKNRPLIINIYIGDDE